MPRWLPLPSITHYPKGALGSDVVAALTVLFLGVPQGLAYATIAGLPPVVGLYASAIPTIVGSLFRSSPYVLAGPTNALSLLVGSAIAEATGSDPVPIALTLALMVGVFQVLAGALKLGALVDFISTAVVLGYITGAGILIGVGQLHNATGTIGPSGRIWVTLGGWLQTLADAQPLAVAVTVSTILTVVAVRRINRRRGKRVPSAIVAMGLGLITNLVFDFEAQGLRVVSDLQPIPPGLPPLTMPDFGQIPGLVPLAIAVAVLSLVESSSVARSLSAKRGETLDASTEFFGQGMANLAAAFTGGYPISGSLSRSALNERIGARTRLAGMIGGVAMLVALATLGQLLDHTPVASLAGLMVVVAVDLVDTHRIRAVCRSSREDLIAFWATMLGTWAFSLDVAIYLGVAITVALFLRRARLVRVVELVPRGARLVEASKDDPALARPVRVLHVEGSLFFGAAGQLRDALIGVLSEATTRVLVVRLKRATGLDATTALTLAELAQLAGEKDRHLVLVGVTSRTHRVLERSGALARFEDGNVFQTRTRWFSAMEAGLMRAAELCPGCTEAFAPFLAATGAPIEPAASPDARSSASGELSAP